jgi:hypothetical protein
MLAPPTTPAAADNSGGDNRAQPVQARFGAVTLADAIAHG